MLSFIFVTFWRFNSVYYFGWRAEKRLWVVWALLGFGLPRNPWVYGIYWVELILDYFIIIEGAIDEDRSMFWYIWVLLLSPNILYVSFKLSALLFNWLMWFDCWVFLNYSSLNISVLSISVISSISLEIEKLCLP